MVWGQILLLAYRLFGPLLKVTEKMKDNIKTKKEHS
ncbi:hypothetical protein WCLE_003660 [Wolbachia endosymbiont of Cimex lectularius]|nr:hypothetical protein WCLE_003660 [Wolbachia endosymbiont of Cimex lectularius]